LVGVGSLASPAQAAGTAMGPPTMLSVFGANAGGRMAVPLELSDARDVITDVSAGRDHAVAVTRSGTLHAWGDDTQGEGHVPPAIAQAGPFRAVAAGADYSLAVTRTGRVLAWGSSASGLTTPPEDLDDYTITAVSAGSSFALALDSEGKLHGWGDNSLQQLEIPQVLWSKRVVKVAAGGAFAVAVTEDGRVAAWGQNWSGQTDVPAQLQGASIDELDVGFAHAVALTTSGDLFTWGDNSKLQLEAPAVPNGWAHVSAGEQFTVGYPISDAGAGAPRVWGEGASTTFAQRPTISGPIPMLRAGGNYVIYGRSELVAVNPPVIEGTARVGEPMSATWATFKPLTPDLLVGRWYEGVSQYRPVGDGTTFTPTAGLLGKKVFFETQAFRAGYRSAASFSASVTILPGRMSATIPAISGTARVGRVLTASATVAPTPDRLLYDWHVGGVFKQATDDGRYTVTSGDVGKAVTVRVTGYKEGYDPVSTELSGPTAVVQDALVMRVVQGVAMTGSGKVGQPLTAVPPVADPTPDRIDYQWYRDGLRIDGATGTTYTPLAADHGDAISVRATLHRADYETATSESNQREIDLGVFTDVTRPTISGPAAVGKTLTAGVTARPAPESVTYDWYVGGALRVSNGAATYSPTSADAGQVVTVRATLQREAFESADSTLSAPTAAVALPEVEIAAPTQVSGRAVAGGVLAAVPPRTAVTGAYGYQWLRDGAPITGAQASTLRLGAADVGRRISVRVTVSSAGWSAAVSTSAESAATVKAIPVLRATAVGKGRRTKVKVSASAPGLPALASTVVVRSGKVVKRVRLATGRVVVTMPRSARRIRVSLSATDATEGRTVVVKGR
jgi:hypothetical protein